MSNILITSAGRRVSLVRAFQKELKKKFPKAKVYTTDINPTLSPACIISDKSFKVQRVDEKNYINNLLDLCIENKVKIVIPTIDTELLILSKSISLFKEKEIDIIVSSTDFVNKCRDKRKIHKFFLSKGIEVATELSKDNLTFPLFIKPSDGSRSVDTFYIKSEEDLTDYHFSNEKFMFLEYIDVTEFTEFTCDLFYGKDSFLKCVVPRERIEVRSGEVSKGKTSKNELLSSIKEKLFFIDGVKGCLTAQFFFNKITKKIIGIEINPRFGGGFPLTYEAGGNFPKWIVQEYLLNQNIEYFQKWKDNLLMLRYDSEVIVENYEE